MEGHTGKPGPGTQRWDAKVGRKVGRKGGTQVINVLKDIALKRS